MSKWFLLNLIPRDSKISTLVLSDRSLFCLVSYKRSRWNFLLFSEIIVLHSEDKKIWKLFSFLFLIGQTYLSQTQPWAAYLVYLHPSEGSVMHYHQKEKGLKKKAKCLYLRLLRRLLRHFHLQNGTNPSSPYFIKA